jgi:hypothetical protein
MMRSAASLNNIGVKTLSVKTIVFLITLPVALGIFLLVSRTARADASARASCVIMPADLDAVTAAEAQGLLAELAARKALLAKTITCAKADVQTLEDDLTSVSSTSDDAKTLQSQLLGRLGDAMNYYDIELVKVNGAGVAGTQAVAKEVLAWRASHYDPLAGQVANFILWSKNQDLWSAAESRLQGIGNLISLLTQAAPNNDLQSDFANAQVLVQTASDENQAARDSLLRSLPPDQSLSIIQRSLQSLSGAYQKFFDISTIAQTLLPTEKTGQ